MAYNRAAAMQSISALLPKLENPDPDPDLRFMQLNDLIAILNNPASESLRNDGHTAARIIDSIIKALTDSNGAVQSQALNCIGPLATRTPSDYIAPYIDKITVLTAQDLDLSVPMTALRVLVAALPRPGSSSTEKDIKDAFSAISRVLIPRLVGFLPLPTDRKIPDLSPGLLQQQKNKNFSPEAVDVAIEVIRAYGTMLRTEELAAVAGALFTTISSPQANGVVKKRALAAMSAIVPFYKAEQLTALIDSFARPLQDPSSLPINHRRYLISGIGALARAIPTRIGPYLPVIAPLVLQVLSQEELDEAEQDSDGEIQVDPETEELREASLVALELLLSSCPSEMQFLFDQSTHAALRYIRYDPNVVSEDDEEMTGTQDAQSDDEFTEDQADDDDEYAELDDDDGFGDVEDVSWKVRRCAAKVLLTIIAITNSADQQGLIKAISPALLSRLNKEREDSVRLEVIAATTALVRKAATITIPSHDLTAPSSPVSHKRKRQDSNVSVNEDFRDLVHSRASPPFVPPAEPIGVQADLASLVPRIAQASVKLWRGASVPLKQAAVLMLKAIAESRNGALADHLQQLEDPLANALSLHSAGGSVSATGSAATAASLQIETLGLISALTETNASNVLLPFVIALIPPVTSLVNDRSYKVSTATLATIEQFAKALSPPRLPATSQNHAIHLEKLYNVTLGPVNHVNADLEVRHRAIQVFGVLISRTSGTSLLSPESRVQALGVLDDRLKNETTRLQSAQAIGLIAEAATVKDNIGSHWVQDVSVELGNHLRKADRTLRAACLEALQYLALNPVTSALYGSDTIATLQAQLLPAISADDLNLLTPALVILSKIIPTNPQGLVDASLIESLCKLAQTRLEGPPLKAYLLIIKVVGEQGLGPPLMKGLLAVGTNGDTSVLGRAIGTLMVFGGNGLGVTLEAFLGEVNNKDDSSACLALAVLGEIGLRMSSKPPFEMTVFTNGLSAKSDKVRLAAAVALGSASSGNIQQYLPSILAGLAGNPNQQYLYMHSLKEILLHAEGNAKSILPYGPDLWERLLAVAAAEDNQAVGAECIGRVILLDPVRYLQELHTSLDDQNAAQRGIVISAFRFTISHNSPTYDSALSRTIVPLLGKMLADPDLSNRRLAMTTFTAVIQNKPEFVLSELNTLMPVVLADTHIKRELIKTVRIGPFTHQEDSGLDLRKSAYATLYTLVESPRAISFFNLGSIFDRVIDGVSDDHDIRTLSNLMLGRLSDLDQEETKRRLPALAEQYKKVLDIKPKENAVKQEIEKINEASSAIIRTSLELSKKIHSTNAAAGDIEMTAWNNYRSYMDREFATMVKQISSDS